MSFGWYTVNHKEMDQPYTGGRKKTSYSEPVPYPVSMDTDERYTPIIRYPTGQNGESYVVITQITRHIAPPPIVTVVPKYVSSTDPGKDERDRPEKVQESLITRVLDETSQPIKSALPLSSSWHAMRIVRDGTNKPHNNTDVYDKPNFNDGKPPVLQAKLPPMQKEINPYPEIIDSAKPRTKKKYQRIINSKQAVEMYNGVEVPPEFAATDLPA